jgi:hypothetical protein
MNKTAVMYQIRGVFSQTTHVAKTIYEYPPTFEEFSLVFHDCKSDAQGFLKSFHLIGVFPVREDQAQ